MDWVFNTNDVGNVPFIGLDYLKHRCRISMKVVGIMTSDYYNNCWNSGMEAQLHNLIEQ